MPKKVLAICTSLRERSNSEALADQFLSGAAFAGHLVEKITLKGKSIAFCRGCFACQKTGRCVMADGAAEIIEKIRCADVIAFATPIYYYEMCGQMKTLLDRVNPLFSLTYSFRKIYMLSAAAERESFVPERAANGLKGWISCFEKAQFAGGVFAGGVTGAGEIEGHAALAEAYEMGKNV